MSPRLQSLDFAALSPLLILLIGVLLLLLLTSLTTKYTKQLCSTALFITLASSLIASFVAPQSENPLLTRWVRFDQSAHFFQILFISIACAVFLISLTFFQKSSSAEGEYYFLLLSSLTGLIFISAAADFLMLFLGLETLSISLYILCAYMKKWGLSAEGAIKYFLMGSLSAAFLLYGIALIYGALGTTRFDHLLSQYQQLDTIIQQTLFLFGIALVTLGLAFKAALVPFHLWAPDVYEGASTPVAAFMAVGTKAGAFAAFVVLFLLFLPQFDPRWNEGTALLTLLTLIYANLVAIRQQQLRRFFAYSGIAHAGFLLIPIVAGSASAFQAIVFYLVVYAIGTMGSFAVLVLIEHNQEKGVILLGLRGLFTRSPTLALILLLALLTLAGIPPTVGFFSKFFVFKLAYQSGYYILLIVGLLTTILSAYYYMRIVAEIFSEAVSDAPIPEYSWPAFSVAIGSSIALLVLSLFPQLLFNFWSASA